MPAKPFAPIVAMLVALANIGVGIVLSEGDVIVGVNKARRDYAFGASNNRCASRIAIATDAANAARCVDQDGAAAVDAFGREHIANKCGGAIACSYFAGATRKWCEFLADNFDKLNFAVGRTAIAACCVAIVALLTNALSTALCLYDTGCRTAIARRCIAIIAFLAGIEDAIAAVGIAVAIVIAATGSEGTAQEENESETCLHRGGG